MKNFILLLSFAISGPNLLIAQQALVLDEYNGEQEIVASESITFKPGFHVAAGQMMHAYIDPLITENIPLVSRPSGNHNYILTNTYQQAGVNPFDLYTGDVSQTITYFDGLGRPIQAVTTNGSPGLKDVIQLMEYDSFGRMAKQYLAYTGGTDGAFKTGAVTAQQDFYNAPPAGVEGTAYPYSRTVFESSPLDRITEQGFAGAAYQPQSSAIANSGHSVKTGYATNNTITFSQITTSRKVALYRVNYSPEMTPILVLSGAYQANQLYVTVNKDENWKSSDGRSGTTEIYRDGQGRTILERRFNTTQEGTLEMLSTYYVYNDLGNLCFVLPPVVSPDKDSAPPTTTQLNEYCYQYRYDGWGRLIEKKLPAKAWEYFVYNELDQMVYSQDGNLRAKNQWLFYKYDGLGRLIVTGHTTSTSSRQAIQNWVNSQTGPLWEERQTGTATGYTYHSYPSFNFLNSSEKETYTIRYYDDYELPSDCPGELKQGPSNQGGDVQGLLTATKTKILGTSTYLWTVYFYDGKGRMIQTRGQNHLQNGIDISTLSYNFTNQLTQAVRVHTASGKTLTLKERYVYDQEARLKNTYHQVNSQPEVLLSSLLYNELGELITKKLHSENGSTPLQTIQYRYNIRDWLYKIDAPKLGIDLVYEEPNTTSAQKQYNGNIAEMRWRGDNAGSRAFAFSYDRLNRLTGTVTTGGNLDETISYGKTGNITKLIREGTSHGTLNYTYASTNRLQSVSGYIASQYSYDPNGNLTKDSHKNITGITYNYLNLPQVVSRTGGNINYQYDATGRKLKQSMAGITRDYVYGIQYENGLLYSIRTPEGRVRKSGNQYLYEYDLKDHLGSVRVRIDKGADGRARLIQENEYYAFGLSKQLYVSGEKSRYMYSGKEFEEEVSLLDYGWRRYDPVIARWTGIDPLANAYSRYSPYSFVMNNPMRYIDPNGLWVENDEGYNTDDPDDIARLWAFYDMDSPNFDEIQYFIRSEMEGEDIFLSNGTFFLSPAIIYQTGSGWKPDMASFNRARNEAYLDWTNRVNNLNVGLTTGETLYRAAERSVVNNGHWAGKNGKYYSISWGGNQYTGSRSGAMKAAKMYKAAGRITIGATVVIGGVNIYKGYQQDGGTFGYHSQYAAAGAAGGLIGGWAGAEAGAAVGAAIGVWFGGVGAVPGAVIGGVVGGVVGGIAGGSAGESVVNYYHGK